MTLEIEEELTIIIMVGTPHEIAKQIADLLNEFNKVDDSHVKVSIKIEQQINHSNFGYG